MPPQVRELNDLIQTLQVGVQPQKALLDADILATETAGKAQEAGLAATAQKEYGNIEQRAQNKGMFFSGFSPDQQAEYNSTTYLPALAQLQATIAGTRSQLLGKKADLDSKVFDSAFQAREGDVNAKRTWDAAETQRQWEAKQAEVDRAFKASESAKDRAAAEAAARRASAQGAATSASQAFDADRKAISSELFQVTGSDGYVSPGSYQKAKNAWVGSGYDAKTFDSYFGAYRNPKNKNYKLG